MLKNIALFPTALHCIKSEDGETFERFYNRINLDERRRKIVEDTKEKNNDAYKGRNTCK
jgi:hypothetical protein